MSRPFRLLVALLFVCVSAIAQQTPLELLGDTFIQPKGGETSPGKIMALIVGVSEYREFPKDAQLRFADADANIFYQMLISPGGGGVDPANVKLLLNKDATASEIYAGLDWLLECDRNDRVIIFFAGHGDVENKTIRQRGFLLAHDSPRAGYQAGGTVKVMDIHDYLETLVTKNHANVLLITDACHAGKLAGGDQGPSQTTAALQEQWTGIVKILSSQPGERSAEGEQWGGGHGVFTYHLVGGLKGLADSNSDGSVSLRELNLYLSSEVPGATEEKQNPLVSGNLQTKLSKVDAKELASLKAARELASKNTNAVATRAVVINDTVSEKTMAWYRKFRDALNSKKLASPNNESALHYYRLIENENRSNKNYVADIRRALVSSLESNAQLVINRYMANDKTLRYDEIKDAGVEMKAAVDLVPQSDIRYNTLLARKLFLENGFLYCICHGDESTSDEAAFALGKLRASLKLEPDAAYVLNSMGNVHYTRRNYDSAKYYFLKASQMAPSWSYPLNNLGTLYEALKNKTEALKSYEAALALDPDYAGIYNNLGNFWFANGKMSDNKKIVDYYTKALDLDTTGASTYLYNLGLTYLNGKKEEQYKASEYFEKMKGKRAAGDYFVELMDVFYGDPDTVEYYRLAAIGEYKKQIEWHPNDSRNYNELGLLCLVSVDYSYAAKENFSMAIKLDPTEPAFFANYARYLSEQTIEYDSVVYYLRKAISLSTTKGLHNLYFNIARAFWNTAPPSTDSAFYYVNKAIEIGDKDQQIDGYSLLSNFYAQQEDYDMAIETYRNVMESGKELTGDNYNSLASWYIGLENYAMAKDKISQALRISKKETVDWCNAHVLLARIAMRQNKTAEALKELATAADSKKFRYYMLKEPDFKPLKSDPKFIKLGEVLDSRN